MPAWLAEVIDGRIGSQSDSRWLRACSQPAIVLTEPPRIRPARLLPARGRLDQQCAYEQTVKRLAPVDSQDRSQDCVDDGVDERGYERGQKPVDSDTGHQLCDQQKGDDLERQYKYASQD
jgi:hypothetical protein